MEFNGIYPAWWTNSLLLKMAIEIVDFPINSMVIFHCYVSSPEGTQKNIWWFHEWLAEIPLIHGDLRIRWFPSINGLPSGNLT